MSSGKFIRANIRDAVKVTLFNVHPLRETAYTRRSPCAANHRQPPRRVPPLKRVHALLYIHARVSRHGVSAIFSSAICPRVNEPVPIRDSALRDTERKRVKEGDGDGRCGGNAKLPDDILREVSPTSSRSSEGGTSGEYEGGPPHRVRINAIIRSAPRGCASVACA